MNVENKGPLKKLAGNDAIWKGTISAAEAVVPEVEGYFVAANVAAPTRCIDGRRNPAAAVGVMPAPQVAGGTAVTTLLWHLVQKKDEQDGATFSQDMQDLLHQLAAHGYGFGGHTDDHHAAGTDENTGCGAVDKLIPILQIIADPAAQPALHALAHTLVGAQYNATITGLLEQRITAFLAGVDVYLERYTQDEPYAYKQSAVRFLRGATENGGGPDPVEQLSGAHQEKVVVINLVPGTTFDRDKFSAAHQDTVQAFNYDVWFTNQLAQMLFPHQADAQTAFLQLQVLYTLATAVVLTDGSLAVLVRSA